jgi:hypothetical protein
MGARRFGLVPVTLVLAACAQEPAPKRAHAQDSYSQAQEQALALGRVLGAVRACEGDAWRPPFHEFMAAKREQGLDGPQTAVIAALVGAAESEAEPGMLECSAEGLSKRTAAIHTMRTEW